MSKVKIPLKWYSDLIHIPSTENEFVLIEWFEDKKCTIKTLWCLGDYERIRRYKINQALVDTTSIRELTLLITDEIKLVHNPFLKSKVNFEILEEQIIETGSVPIIYDYVKRMGVFDNIK